MYNIKQIEEVGAAIHNQPDEHDLKAAQMAAISNVYLSMLQSQTTVVTKEALSPQDAELIAHYLKE